MLRGHTGIAASVLTALAAQTASAQVRMMQLDVNGASFQSMNSAGQAAPFGGTTASGSLVFTEQVSVTELLSVGISTSGGPFMPQAPDPWNLTNLAITINLNNGNVTGGSISLDINGGPTAGDNYHATIGAAGGVSTYVGGGFLVQGLTLNGAFSDAMFDATPIPDFFNQQNPPFLSGSFLIHLDAPNPDGSGSADLDGFVSNIPGPSSATCLITAGILAGARRRRR